METWQPRLTESLGTSGEISAFGRGLKWGKGEQTDVLLVLENWTGHKEDASWACVETVVLQAVSRCRTCF